MTNDNEEPEEDFEEEAGEEEFEDEDEENYKDSEDFDSIEDIVDSGESPRYPSRFRQSKATPFLEITDDSQQTAELETGVQSTPTNPNQDNQPQYSASAYVAGGRDYESAIKYANAEEDGYPKQMQQRQIASPFLKDSFSTFNMPQDAFSQPRLSSSEFSTNRSPEMGESKKYESGLEQEFKKIKDAKRRI